MACNPASVFHQARNISVGQYRTGQDSFIKLVALKDNCRRKSRQRMRPEVRAHAVGLQSLDLTSPDSSSSSFLLNYKVGKQTSR